MKLNRKGFSLVELLAVILVLTILAAVAIPLYLNTRRTSAARVCKANIVAIASAQSAWGLRFSAYVGDQWNQPFVEGGGGGLIGAPEGLAKEPLCPLDGSHYTCSVDAVSGDLTVSCPNAAAHADVTGRPSSDWQPVYRSAGRDMALP